QARARLAKAAAPHTTRNPPVKPASLSIHRDEIDATDALGRLEPKQPPKTGSNRSARNHE
ncbi:MAG: hypothetical protein KJ752_09490, partial [Alphaproteobacteria bacterium]|nr:hypothetical protein [Alphaproteobacteria bacterium]